MKPTWLFETDYYGEQIQDLISEVRNQGMRAITLADRRDHYRDVVAPDACVVFYGTLQFAADIRRETSWVPGVYCSQERLSCRAYYPELGHFLLAKEYEFVRFGDLLPQKDRLFDRFGEDDAVFLRPDRGDKLFTGQVVYRENYDKDVPVFGFAAIDPWELVVVSKPRNITREWRFVVVDGKVITGSRYRTDGRRTIWRLAGTPGGLATADQAADDDEARVFAQRVADARYDPDRAYTLDVCKTASGTLYLLELNSFTSSGLYACHPASVVREVSRVALEEWEISRIILKDCK